jgi:hypothetical protein
MSNADRGPSIDAFYQVSVSEEKIFRNQSIRNNNWPVAAMLVNGLGRNKQYL